MGITATTEAAKMVPYGTSRAVPNVAMPTGMVLKALALLNVSAMRNSVQQAVKQKMPAVNTPQFSWVRSRLPRHPQPVPPIYQPEVAARAVLLAADHPRHREYWAGATTVATITANRFVPGLLDRYLARTGYDAQQTDEPVRPDRPSNLFEPVPGDPGAHGRFDRRARPRSFQLWETTHRGWLALAAGIGLAGAAAAVWKTRS